MNRERVIEKEMTKKLRELFEDWDGWSEMGVSKKEKYNHIMLHAANIIKQAGYRLIPELKVLRDEGVACIMMDSERMGWEKGKDVAQAQRDYDLRQIKNLDNRDIKV